MKNKNVYLFLILVVMFFSTIIGSKIETGVFKYYYSGFNALPAIIIGFLSFSWCIEHAKYYEIELPKGSALLVGFIAFIGVPVYLIRGFGLKDGLIKTAKSLGFLLIVIVTFTLALWVVGDPVFN